jgi:acetylornithine/N-succinyldiaminopimelate aminotransferase
MDNKTKENKYFFRTYNRIPIEIERGKGVYLYAKNGESYLDMFGGLAVNALGYGNKNIAKAIIEQSKKYIHLSNYYLQEPQIKLAEMLVSISRYKKVFFTNSGTECIEGAIKIARKWGCEHGKKEILSFTNAFHGRTMGALSLMDRQRYVQGYEPFLPDCTIAEFNNVHDLKAKISSDTAAVILEFIQGEGGIIPATAEFINALYKLKEKFGFLIVADEIQSGLGRTGKLFCFEHFKFKPDIVLVAKPLGGGLPLGAILGNDKVADVLESGTHGSTFGGNPVACAAGIAFLKELDKQHLIHNAKTMGNFLRTKLDKLHNEFTSIIKNIRGYGLMIGMELNCEGECVVSSIREKGVLINCTNKNVLRFLPPLIIGEKEITKTITLLREAFKFR